MCCDIYRAKCAECNTRINMHLGDFNTSREEIIVLCHEHVHLYPKYGSRVVFWAHNYVEEMNHKINYPSQDHNIFGSDEPFVAVISLTQNAWENRMHNNPNDGFSEPIPDVDMYIKYMEVWTRAAYSEHSDWNPDGIGTRLVVVRDAAIKVFSDWWEEITKDWEKIRTNSLPRKVK